MKRRDVQNDFGCMCLLCSLIFLSSLFFLLCYLLFLSVFFCLWWFVWNLPSLQNMGVGLLMHLVCSQGTSINSHTLLGITKFLTTLAVIVVMLTCDDGVSHTFICLFKAHHPLFHHSQSASCSKVRSPGCNTYKLLLGLPATIKWSPDHQPTPDDTYLQPETQLVKLLLLHNNFP